MDGLVFDITQRFGDTEHGQKWLLDLKKYERNFGRIQHEYFFSVGFNSNFT